MSKIDIFAPIPSVPLPNTNGINIAVCDDPLICISDLIQDSLVFQPRYFERGLLGAIPRMYVRKTVAEMLLIAARSLPAGYKLKIYDAWRPPAVQKALFDEYYAKLRHTFKGTVKSAHELMEMALQFVSYPSTDPDAPFVHSTGGAVDLTVVDPNGKELNMGTDFDDFSDSAHTDYFESASSHSIRNNRRMLYNVMISAGFTNYPSEWWHYDYGDRFWAALKNQDSIYQGIYTEPILGAP